MDNAKAILEGLLFLSGEEGLTMDQMMHGLQNLEMDDIRVLLDALKKEYSSSSKGIELVEYANRFKFVTKESKPATFMPSAAMQVYSPMPKNV